VSEAGPVLGFDIGGQSIKAALVSPQGAVFAQASAPTGPDTDVAGLGRSLAGLRDELSASAPPQGPVGIGVAGVLDRSGRLRGAPHLPRLIGHDIAALASEALGRPTVVHNDADCAAMAEGWNGAAAGCADFLLVAVGTGLGSGLVLGGRLRAGNSGYGCEFGHMLLALGGRLCGCGNRGCLEAYCSETAAGALVAEAGGALQERVHQRRRLRGGGHAQAVFELGEEGDLDAERIGGVMVEALGAAIASFTNTVDLTTFVLGGGIAPALLARPPQLRRAAARSLFARPESALTIVAASAGPLAGALGAARLAMLAR
jgi:glucokinase